MSDQDLSQYNFTTPMMKQYLELKKEYLDCLLLFRLGDFYELFLDDAKVASNILDITLTKRDRGSDGEVPMAGVPYHAVDSYLSKLVKAGHKVAVCEQLSDPSKDSKIVERDVVRIVTPGTVLDENSLDRKENNYIFSVSLNDNSLGIAVCDISTGDFFTNQFDEVSNPYTLISEEVLKLDPSECVLKKELYENSSLMKSLKVKKDINVYEAEKGFFNSKPKKFLHQHFEVDSLEGFGIKSLPLAVESSAVLLSYLKHTQKNKISHINRLKKYTTENYLHMDTSTITNLELFSTLRDSEKKGSLINHLDYTKTAMGGRKLRSWVKSPLTNVEKIEKRQQVVQELFEIKKQKKVKELLENIIDIERLLARISVGISNPRDFVSLKESLKVCLEVKKLITGFDADLWKSYTKMISSDLQKLVDKLDNTILEEPGIEPKKGKIVKEGVNKKLDELKEGIRNSKEYISSLEKEEREKTGISSLKVKFNKVYGYYIEVTKAASDKVPDDYYRKQTLVNAERFITEELKEHEEKILNAEEKIEEIEYEIFLEMVEEVLKYVQQIQEAAKAVSEIDCLLSFSIVSQRNNYSRPVFNEEDKIDIVDGRHPVVERTLDDEEFVPNDSYLNSEDNQLLILTGPNMAGKSVYIRQVALICLVAQTGCFVPAKSADLSIFEKIFVRSGASDVITSGLSTFMVEMVETANILNNSNSKTLIVMDEVGRGTSTYDGISIAQAVVEYLVSNKKCIRPKTLFATHYHELQELESKFPKKVKNFQMKVKKENNKPVFLYKVVEGGADHSYGISVAKLAGVPKEVTSRAYEILEFLETNHKDVNSLAESKKKFTEASDKSPLLQEIKKLKLSSMTPLEALNKLSEIQEELKDRNKE